MSRGQRVFWLSMAAMFFITTVAFTGMVLWQMRQDDKTRRQAEATQKALEDLQAGNQEGKLEGKPMQGFTPVEKINELQSTDLKEGTGEAVTPGATITAHYTGAVAATGVVFQSSYDAGQPATFGLAAVIAGWTEGVPGMKVGGIRRLLIPAEKAYGANPPQNSNIPANADLVFDIELVKIGE